MAESAGYALTAITLSIVFIYIVLGSQFNSFIHLLRDYGIFTIVIDWCLSGLILI
jgi:multidrug efflux pump subunit AcrB